MKATQEQIQSAAGPPRQAEVEARETAYWDRQASLLSQVEPDAGDALLRTVSNQRRMALLGELRGTRLLDVGCGTGRWSVLLAQQGAEVWAIDISPESIAAVKRRAALAGVEERVHALVMSATSTDLPEAFFNVVHGQDIIHHLDAGPFGKEVARVLAPGGRAIFSENSANNRLLMFARNNLCGRWGIPRWSSDDEYPLTRAKLSQFARYFGSIQVEYPEFLFFLYFNAKVFRYRSKLVGQICHRLDRAVARLLPFLRQYSYRQMICCREPQPDPCAAPADK